MRTSPIVEKRKRVLHIVGDSKFGGGAAVILRLAEMAQNDGHDVDILSTDAEMREVFARHGVGLVYLDCIWRNIRPWRDLNGLLRLMRFLRASDYDLVHTHTSKGGFVGRIAARLAGIPHIIHTVHGFAFHEESSRTEIRLWSALERLASHACDQIVTVSEHHRGWALRLGIGRPDRIHAIPNGLNSNRVVSQSTVASVRASIGVEPQDLLLLSTGRLARQKGLNDLIAAAPILTTQLKQPFKVVIAGDGPLRSRLEAQAAELGLKENVLFLGFRQDLGDLLAAADVVVLPSLWEGLSISLLEAMAAGKAIVTTTIGSNCEATHQGDAALLVPPHDPRALAVAIETLATNHELAKAKGNVARHIYETCYTPERMMEGYRLLYRQSPNKHPNKRSSFPASLQHQTSGSFGTRQ